MVLETTIRDGLVSSPIAHEDMPFERFGCVSEAARLRMMKVPLLSQRTSSILARALLTLMMEASMKIK